MAFTLTEDNRLIAIAQKTQHLVCSPSSPATFLTHLVPAMLDLFSVICLFSNIFILVLLQVIVFIMQIGLQLNNTIFGMSSFSFHVSNMQDKEKVGFYQPPPTLCPPKQNSNKIHQFVLSQRFRKIDSLSLQLILF